MSQTYPNQITNIKSSEAAIFHRCDGKILNLIIQVMNSRINSDAITKLEYYHDKTMLMKKMSNV